MLVTKKDLSLLFVGAAICFVLLVWVRAYISPEPPCGYDGQPDAHWQAEFNRIDHEWRMYSHCLESGSVEKCKKEWGK